MNNVYTEEFRINAVSVVRAGIPVHALARRLSIPETSIRNWLDNPRYAEIGPASKDLLNNIPEKAGPRLIQVTSHENKNNEYLHNGVPIKIRTGKIEIELSNLCGLKEIIKALGEAGVL